MSQRNFRGSDGGGTTTSGPSKQAKRAAPATQQRVETVGTADTVEAIPAATEKQRRTSKS